MQHERSRLSSSAAFGGRRAVRGPDPQETAEWLDALESTVTANGPRRAHHILGALAERARQKGIGWAPELSTPYVNTIAVADQPAFPGDLAIEERLGALMRWNALAMVVRANKAYGELGGHIASYASAADLFEVGFNHFFRARDRATTATWCSSSPTARQASTRARSSRDG